MKKQTRISYPIYLFQHLTPALLFCVFYYTFLFVNIPSLSVNVSKRIYFLGNQAIWIALAFLTPPKRRSVFTAVFNVALAYTPYFLITYASAYHKFILGYAAVIIALSIFYFSAVVFKKIKNKPNARKIIRKRLRFAFNGIKNIAGVFCLLLLFGFVFCSFLGIRPLQSDAPLLASANATDAEQWTVKNNIDTVKLLRPDDWKELSVEEKLDVLSVVRNIEVRYLGIPHEIYLATSPANDGNYGYYDHKEHTIVISYKLLKSDDVEETLKTVCHEMHHAYAYNQIEVYKTLDDKYKNLLLFDGAKAYEKEFEDYISAEDDFWGYFMQEAEIDAEIYAKNSLKDYYRLIDKYLNEDEANKTTQNNI